MIMGESDLRRLVAACVIVVFAVAVGVVGAGLYERIFNNGIQIRRADEHGVLIGGTDSGNAIHINGAKEKGLYLRGSGSHGVDVASAGGSGVKVYSAGNDGVRVDSAAWSGVYVASSGADALRVGSSGRDMLRLFEKVGRDYIRAGSDSDPDFRVTKNGTAYADGGFKGKADFAELMAVEGDPSNYEPGDVLVISDKLDRTVTLSREPNSTSLMGVYSKDPGFVGSNNVMDGQNSNEIAVAVIGIVPCKVSDENGPIYRGDLLTTSSTRGHAMKASEGQIGAILGKAFGNLEEGTGVIEILLTLQ
jgi:hypothetical protein